MKLSLALITRKICVTATDRRISDGNRAISDEHDKTTALVTDDAKVSISFAGLARAGFFNTHEWLLQALCDSGKPDFGIKGSVTRLAAAATKEFATNTALRRLAPSQRRLSILLAGYKFSDKGCLPIYAIISNFERPDLKQQPSADATPEFHVSAGKIINDAECITLAVGDFRNIDASRVVSLRAHADLLKPEAISFRLVDIIRRSAFAGQPMSTIGSQISTITITPDKGVPIPSKYHSAAVQRTSYMPAMVFSQRRGSVAVTDIRIEPKEMPPPAHVPVVSQNRPCPCGSGRKYKRCHGANRLSV